jgi:hypothetical protein
LPTVSLHPETDAGSWQNFDLDAAHHYLIKPVVSGTVGDAKSSPSKFLIERVFPVLQRFAHKGSHHDQYNLVEQTVLV